MLLQLFLRTSTAIERIAEGFSDIAKALPRFEEYQTFFTSAPRLNEALVDLYELVVRFFINTIKLFRRHPISGLPLASQPMSGAPPGRYQNNS